MEVCGHSGCDKKTIDLYCYKHSCRECKNFYVVSDNDHFCSECQNKYSDEFVQKILVYHNLDQKLELNVQRNYYDRYTLKILTNLYERATTHEQEREQVNNDQNSVTDRRRCVENVDNKLVVFKNESDSDSDTSRHEILVECPNCHYEHTVSGADWHYW